MILKIEEQQKKALEEDPSVFDYDGVYDEMKEQSFHRKVQARADTQVYFDINNSIWIRHLQICSRAALEICYRVYRIKWLKDILSLID